MRKVFVYNDEKRSYLGRLTGAQASCLPACSRLCENRARASRLQLNLIFMRAFPVLASLERGKQDACAPVLIDYKKQINFGQLNLKETFPKLYEKFSN